MSRCPRTDNQEIRQCLARKRLRFPLQLLSAPPSRHAPATLPIAGHARRRSRSSSNKFGERLHSPSRRSFITSRHLARYKTPRAKPSQTPMLRSNARQANARCKESDRARSDSAFCDGITRGRWPSSHRATAHRFRRKAVNAFSYRRSPCRLPS